MTKRPIQLDPRNPYANEAATESRIRESGHRKVVGGMWEEVGQLQRSFLISQGLSPKSMMLDVGCGALRGGIHFVDYLNAGNYFGIDNNQPLMDAGFEIELPKVGLQEKLPRSNLFCCRDFDARGFGVSFDFALAQSVFTHIPLSEIKLALSSLSPVMKPGGKFFATFFNTGDADAAGRLRHVPGGIETFPDKNPFHQSISQWCDKMNENDWSFHLIGDWGLGASSCAENGAL